MPFGEGRQPYHLGMTQSAKGGGEILALRELIEMLDVRGITITADALARREDAAHDQHKHMLPAWGGELGAERTHPNMQDLGNRVPRLRRVNRMMCHPMFRILRPGSCKMAVCGKVNHLTLREKFDSVLS